MPIRQERSRVWTVLVAASDAPDSIKAQADRICSGANDEVDINWAVEQLTNCSGYSDLFAGSYSSGGIVKLSEGTFEIDDTITLDRHGMTLKGHSRGGTVLHSNTAITMIEVTGDNSIYDVTISDMTIAGARVAGAIGIALTKGIQSKIERMSILRMAPGISYTTASGTKFEDLYFYANKGAIWQDGGTSNNIKFKNCYFSQSETLDAWYDAVRVSTGTSIKFNECAFDTNGTDIVLSYDNGASNGVVIDGCHFEKGASATYTGVTGYSVYSAKTSSAMENLHITGSYFTGNSATGADYAIYLNRVWNSIIDGSTKCISHNTNSLYIETTCGNVVYNTGGNRFNNGVDDNTQSLSISGGVITIISHEVMVDTQTNNPTDELDTINIISGMAFAPGEIIILRCEHNDRTVTAKDGTGNLKLAGDFDLDHTDDRLVLQWDGTNWFELSRSDNG